MISIGQTAKMSCMAYAREAEFNEALCARVKRLREEHEDWSQEQMATALGLPYDRYRKYEYRTPLPSYLFEQFSNIVGRDIEYLVTGKSSARRRNVGDRTGTRG